MKKKYIIWDFDGTLANTNDVILDSWKATYDHYLGSVPSDKEIIATFGETLKRTIAERFQGETYEEVRDFYRAYQDEHCAGKVYVSEGVRELLDELRARGLKLAVATSRTSYSYGNYMKELGLEGYMDVVVSMEDVTRHKPDPESVNAVLIKLMANDRSDPADDQEQDATDDQEQNAAVEQIALTDGDAVIPESVRSEAIMIGDSKYDIGCAANAGVESVLVGWSHPVDLEAMEAEGFAPTYFIERPEELLELI